MAKSTKTFWIVFAIIGVVVLLIAMYGIGSYNRFVTLDQNINGKWSEVENQYQRQADLIDNLVSVVQSSVNVETKFVKEVIDARANWKNAAGALNKDTTGVEMTNSVTTFVNAVAENYPELQANKQYVTLTDEMAGTQNRITVARGRYIEAIQTYNSAILKFPSNLLAGMFGFGAREYYKADVNSLQTPKLGNGTLP